MPVADGYTIRYGTGKKEFVVEGDGDDDDAFGPFPIPDDGIALVSVDGGDMVLVALDNHTGPLELDTVYGLNATVTDTEEGVDFAAESVETEDCEEEEEEEEEESEDSDDSDEEETEEEE